jgi:chromosomal replication initiation ATPase DnaA
MTIMESGETGTSIPSIHLAQAYRDVVVRRSLRHRALFLEACRAAGTTPEAVRPGSRHLRAVAARQLVYALLRSAGLSYPTIAILVGYKEHSAVMYGVRRVRARRQVVLRVAQQKFREMTGL